MAVQSAADLPATSRGVLVTERARFGKDPALGQRDGSASRDSGASMWLAVG